MKLGLVAFPNPVEQYVEFAADNGFEHMEIDFYSTPQWLEKFTASRIRQLRGMFEEIEISISFHVPYTLNLAEPLPFLRTAVMKYFERVLQIAVELNAQWVCVHPGYAIGLPQLPWIRSEALNRLRESLEHLLPRCEALNIPIALENVNPLPPKGELVLLGDNLPEMQRVLEEFNTPFLRMVLDVGHANTAEGPVMYIERLHQFIIGTHIHDNSGMGDEHLPLGEGTMPWDEMVEAFKSVNFSGPLNVELFDDADKLKGKHFLMELLERHGVPVKPSSK